MWRTLKKSDLVRNLTAGNWSNMSSLSLLIEEDEDDEDVEDDGVEEEEVPELEGAGSVVDVEADVGDWTADGVEGERSGGAAVPGKQTNKWTYTNMHM